jgi:hypothetical protein
VHLQDAKVDAELGWLSVAFLPGTCACLTRVNHVAELRCENLARSTIFVPWTSTEQNSFLLGMVEVKHGK